MKMDFESSGANDAADAILITVGVVLGAFFIAMVCVLVHPAIGILLLIGPPIAYAARVKWLRLKRNS